MVLDPFSAASKPFVPPDESLPKRPLQFAATLNEPFNLILTANSSAAQPKLPRPKLNHEKDGIPTNYPESPYSHSRHVSSASITSVNPISASLDLLGFGTPAGRTKEVGSDEWMIDMVATCVDAAKGDLTITGLGLTTLSTKIADLRDLVTLPKTSSPKPRLSAGPPRSPFTNTNSRYPDLSLSPGSTHLSANARSFTRSTSAPATSAFFSTSPSRPQNLNYNRTPSGLGTLVQAPASPTTTEASEEGDDSRSSFVSPTTRRTLLGSPSLPAPASPSSPSFSPSAEQRKRAFGRSKTGAVNLMQMHGKAMDIAIYAGQNQLKTLPSALFEISNLTVLSLRGNKLTSLPAAIGELNHLKELNISLNQITVLPSTILNLNLELFTASSNNFIQKDPEIERFSELKPHHEDNQPVPRLANICMNLLLSPRPPNGLPPILDMYEWNPPVRGVPHPLVDPDAMHDIIPGVPKRDVSRVLQALRTASTQYTNRRRSGGSSGSLMRINADPLPRSHRPLPPDDASTNPYFYSCPSPRHFEQDFAARGGSSTGAAPRPSKHIFLEPAEERIEWREVFKTKDLPVKWIGCSPGCLAFLDHEDEDEDEDEWLVDTDTGTNSDTDVDDGQ